MTGQWAVGMVIYTYWILFSEEDWTVLFVGSSRDHFDGIIYILKSVENINNVKNQVDRITINILLKQNYIQNITRLLH